jgi:hypothetical protein
LGTAKNLRKMEILPIPEVLQGRNMKKWTVMGTPKWEEQNYVDRCGKFGACE